MLAKRRSIVLNGQELERTPLLVPSFSSKGFADVDNIVEYCSELIEGPTLVSAYDLHYKKVSPPFTFPSIIFLDSGGYEASKDADLSELGEREHSPKLWTPEMHSAVVATWAPSVSSVIISYDHPKSRLSVAEQIRRARELAVDKNVFVQELLLKPETERQKTLPIAEVLKHIHELAGFGVIGVTEKEIGTSLFERMKNIACLRQALSRIGLETPIHVFGSLDTISTPLYFLAGADIFDGLTWLRFAFHQGQTIYKQNFGALSLGVGTKSHIIDGHCWNQNYLYMNELQAEMRRFLSHADFSVFKYHQDLFRNALQSVEEALGA